jgi:platelet-activating factor acetylhydrolase isoform II
MVIVWYPAEIRDEPVHALWMPERWAFSEALLLYNQRLNLPNPLTIGEAQQDIRGIVSSSIAEAPLAQASKSWPVLLFAPGAGVHTAFYSTFTEDLASHGYVVFGIVPTGWITTTFPDGRTEPASNKRSDNPGWITGTALPLWTDDLRFMLDQIEGLNRNSSSIFFHRLDLNEVGAFGHSFGGAASISAGLQDARIKAVLNLDGSPFGLLSKRVLPKPFMVIKHDISAKYAVVPPDPAGKAMQAKVEEELSSVYLRGRPGYRLGVAEAKHMTFSDMAVLQTWADAGRRFGTQDSIDGTEVLKEICVYIRAFFDKFLLAESTSQLDSRGKFGIYVLDSNAGSKMK